MGLIAVLDKSALQSLSQRECVFLEKYYYLNVPPVLVMEILADLKKRKDKEAGEREVQILANKLPRMASKFNVHFRDIALASLLGNQIPMQGQIIVPAGKKMADGNGKEFVLFEEPPEAEALGRWRDQRFEDAETLVAQRFRQTSRAIDLEVFKKRTREEYDNLPECKNLGAVKNLAEDLLATKDKQLQWLRWTMRELGVVGSMATVIEHRWLKTSPSEFSSFAPYAYYVAKVFLLFQVGLSQNLIGTRATNRIDLEYLMYLPFCFVFSSCDTIHEDLGRVLVEDYQYYMNGAELKSDLRRLADWWDAMSEEERHETHNDLGGYPPDWDDLVTNKLWTRYMRPRGDRRKLKISEEQNEQIYEKLRPMLDAIKNREKNRDC